jgi:hypothetical protein
MKRILKDEHRVQRCLRPLYLDDYEELTELLCRGRLRLKVTADDFELDNPEEVDKLNQSLVKELQLRTAPEEDGRYVSPFEEMRVRILRSHASVYFCETDRGRALEVLELLKKKVSTLRMLNERVLPFAGFVGFLTILLFLRLKDLPKRENNSLLLVGFALAIISACWWGWANWPERNGVVLILKRRSAEVGFFQRKKDDLRMLGIGAVIGATLSFFVQALIRFLWPPPGTGH